MPDTLPPGEAVPFRGGREGAEDDLHRITGPTSPASGTRTEV
jgi:hypothetical protein